MVQQQSERRNGAAARVFTKKRGREGGEPGHAGCQREEAVRFRFELGAISPYLV